MSLTTEQLGHLRSKTHRFKLYLAVWDQWQLQQSTPLLTDASTDPPTLVGLGTETEADVPPIVNIGPNRLAFVGETISFDALRSFNMRGDPPSSATWSFASANTTVATGLGPFSRSWASPGLYTVTCTIGSTVATRKVRVLANRQSLAYDITAVDGVSGGISAGWKASLTCMQTSGAVSLANFQSVGIFIEDQWYTDTWETDPISGYTPEPRLLLSGYIQSGSIQFDANTHLVQFSIASLQDQMSQGFIHATQTWNNEYIAADLELAIPGLPNPPQGIILDIGSGLKMRDVLYWWLQRYTNIFDRHDFLTWYDASLQEIDDVSTSETSVWSAFSSLAENEYAWMFVDQGGGLHFEPNPHIRSATWFNGNYPVKMTLTEEDILTISASELMMRNVIWVQLIGTRTRDGRQWTARYPGDTPASGPGSWLMKNGLLVSRGSFLDDIIPRVYADANRKFTVQITLPLNRAFSVPDRVKLTVDIDDRGIHWVNKEFIVAQVSYAINVAATTWQTTLSAVEVV